MNLATYTVGTILKAIVRYRVKPWSAPYFCERKIALAIERADFGYVAGCKVTEGGILVAEE